MRAIVLTLLAVVLIGGASQYWQRSGKSDAASAGRTEANAAMEEGEAEGVRRDSVAGSASEGPSLTGRGGVGGGGGVGAVVGRDRVAGRLASQGGSDADRGSKKSDRDKPSTFYQWVDERGSVHFAASLDEIPANWRGRAGQVALDAAVINRTDAPAAKPVRPRPVVEVAAVDRSHDVTIYTAPSCGWCRKTIAFLDQRRVEYVNKDIDADEENARELREKSGSSAIPFVEIDGTPIRGFNPAQMTALLGS